MKRKLALISGVTAVAIIMLVSLAGCSAGSTVTAGPGNQLILGGQQQGISVSGEGKVTVTPDLATLSLGISVQADNVASAQAQASSAMDKIIASLTANGVDKKDIQTQNFSIQQIYTSVVYNVPVPPVTGSGGSSLPVITTSPGQILQFQVSNTVTVTVRAVDKTGAIIDAAAVAGGDLTRVNGVSFSVSNPEQYYSQARQAAVKDAADKAAQLAKSAGVTLGKATYISESSNTPVYPIYNGVAAIPATSTTSINPGQTDITIDVQIVYSIQ